MIDTPEVLNIDLNDLTLGDLEDFEKHSGIPFAQLDSTKREDLPLSALIALVWITKRRANPDYTYEDARNTSIRTLKSMDIKETELPPT